MAGNAEEMNLPREGKRRSHSDDRVNSSDHPRGRPSQWSLNLMGPLVNSIYRAFRVRNNKLRKRLAASADPVGRTDARIFIIFPRNVVN